MKCGENCSSGFREEAFKDFIILHIYIALWQGHINHKILMVAKQFYIFYHMLLVSAISFLYILRK